MRRPRCRCRNRFAAPTAAVAAAAAGMMVLAGCQFPAMLIANMPQSKVPAEYEPKDRPTLVLVDDPQEQLPTGHLAKRVADEVADQLKREEVVSRFIELDRLEALELEAEDFDRWAIDEVGRRLGAEQVIYILVEEFEFNETPQTYRPAGSMRVKVVDVETGERLYPEDDRRGRAVSDKLFYKQKLGGDTRGEESLYGRSLALRLADQAAKLFYKHKPRPVGSEFPE